MPDVREIQRAVRYLAGRCDGARKLDYCGFNATDSYFGKSLAAQERWTQKQAEAALKMIRKYEGQLADGGFDVKALFDGSPITCCDPTQLRPSQPKMVRLVNGQMEIRFPYDERLLKLVRDIPGRRFNTEKKFWTAPVNPDAVQKLKEAGFEIDPELTKLLQPEQEQPTGKQSEEIEVPGLKRELFPFQRKGVAFIEAKGGRALIGDEMGLGKTIQALAWLELHPEKRPAIILCPAHLKLNWVKEIAKTLPGQQNVQVIQGTKPYPITGSIVIINYDILNQWVDVLKAINPQVLVFDEAHYIKNSSAQRTKATKKLAKGIPHVIALTGTPIVNRPVEGFNIVQILNKAVFPDFWSFAHRYCGARHNGFGWDFSGATNKEELHHILTSTVMIRRKKADVLKDLPEKLYSYMPMELENQNEYRAAELDFIRYLRQVKGDEAASKAGNAEHLVKIEALKQLAVRGKLKQAIDWIHDFITSGNGDSKLVVFAIHRAVIDTLMSEFKDTAVKVDGSCSAEQRDKAVEKFQNDPETKLFVGNIRAAGTGLTLTAASSVAFLELPWTPGELVQAEDRCHRIGQKDTVNVYYLLADGTIEYRIAQMLDEKRSVVNAVVDGEEVEEKSLLTALIEGYCREGA